MIHLYDSIYETMIKNILSDDDIILGCRSVKYQYSEIYEMPWFGKFGKGKGFDINLLTSFTCALGDGAMVCVAPSIISNSFDKSHLFIKELLLPKSKRASLQKYSDFYPWSFLWKENLLATNSLTHFVFEAYSLQCKTIPDMN